MRRRNNSSLPSRFLGVIFGLVFAGIGLSVIGMLWTQRGFGEPPVFAKIFGSLVAVPFVAVGATLVFSVIRGRAPGSSLESAGAEQGAAAAGYACPGCGARLGDAADVSPKGDVKCPYCRQWFNIHG
jgi:DNA-directed RNA polymerase subunit RPC12/RpoP